MQEECYGRTEVQSDEDCRKAEKISGRRPSLAYSRCDADECIPAIRYDYPMERAQLAGLLHDCAKCIPAKKKLKICKDNKIPVTDFEREHTFLLHAKVGAWVAREKYGVTDPEILSAITWHTTGKENMTLLEKIVYIADYIEPARNKAPRLAEIRKIAFENLDLCMYEILHDTLEYLDDDPQDIDQATIQAYNYYSDLINTK